MAEMKLQEQEILIQEQFQIIEDYSSQIESHNLREQLQNQRISELEEELQKVIDAKCKESFAFIEKARGHGNEMIEERTDSANDDQSCSKSGLDHSKLTANSSSSNGRNVNGLREDID